MEHPTPAQINPVLDDFVQAMENAGPDKTDHYYKKNKLNGKPILSYDIKLALATKIQQNFAEIQPRKVFSVLFDIFYDSIYNFSRTTVWMEKNRQIYDPAAAYPELAAQTALIWQDKNLHTAGRFWNVFLAFMPTQDQFQNYKPAIQDYLRDARTFSQSASDNTNENNYSADIKRKQTKLQRYFASSNNKTIPTTSYRLPRALHLAQQRELQQLNENSHDLLNNEILQPSEINPPALLARAEFLSNLPDQFAYNAYASYEMFAYHYLFDTPKVPRDHAILYTQSRMRELGQKNGHLDLHHILATTAKLRESGP